VLLIKLPGASAASCTVDVVASFLLISHACVNGSVIQILISAALASMVHLPQAFYPESGVVRVVRFPFPLFIGFMPNSLYFRFKQWKWGLPHVEKKYS